MKKEEKEFSTDGRQDSLEMLDVYADIVYCIDITGSMAPVIDLVKNTALTLHKELQERMRTEYQRSIKQLRIKVIGFRDFYADGKYALEMSEFFSLPEQEREFEEFIEKLEAKGGGDIPKNSLEALALAMKSEWCQTVDPSVRKRHIIVLFTDAPAHPLEKAVQEKPEYYPEGMPRSYTELLDWWWGQGNLADKNSVSMDQIAKRLVIFATEGFEPWESIAEDCDHCMMSYIEPDEGGKGISTDALFWKYDAGYL